VQIIHLKGQYRKSSSSLVLIFSLFVFVVLIVVFVIILLCTHLLLLPLLLPLQRRHSRSATHGTLSGQRAPLHSDRRNHARCHSGRRAVPRVGVVAEPALFWLEAVLVTLDLLKFASKLAHYG
jgi:hypothetical protein